MLQPRESVALDLRSTYVSTRGLGIGSEKMIGPQNTGIQDKHASRMPLEERFQRKKNGLNLFLRNDGQDHLQTARIIKHEVTLMVSAVAFSRNITEDGIPARFDSIQDIRDKTDMFSFNNDLDLFHGK